MNANKNIRAVIGLGNPGRKYAHTYHNIGAWSLKYFKDVLTYQPKSFMNESGRDIAVWMKLNNLTPSEIIVVHDDSDILIGDYKISTGGGSAGHKGVQSLIENLTTPDFMRLRIGIRNPDEQVRKKAVDFVLERFSKDREEIFKEVLQKVWAELQQMLGRNKL